MKVLSLYDGMSCGMLALNSAGISVDRYVAYEIDKYAIRVSEHNFPMIEHKGDVFKGDFTEYQGFDIVFGGSPCTLWLISQKKDVRETEAHGIGWDLFQRYVRAVREAKPRFFIYENNKSMAKAIRDEIDVTFGFECIEINSALVSAQKREREIVLGRDTQYRRNVSQSGYIPAGRPPHPPERHRGRHDRPREGEDVDGIHGAHDAPRVLHEIAGQHGRRACKGRCVTETQRRIVHITCHAHIRNRWEERWVESQRRRHGGQDRIVRGAVRE